MRLFPHHHHNVVEKSSSSSCLDLVKWVATNLVNDVTLESAFSLFGLRWIILIINGGQESDWEQGLCCVEDMDERKAVKQMAPPMTK